METVAGSPVRRLLIVDGHAYAYRAFHAIRQLTSPAGAPTNAIYGFIKMLGKLRARLEPERRGAGEAERRRIGEPAACPPSGSFSHSPTPRLADSPTRRLPDSPRLRVTVVWDGGLAAERLAALPGYQAQRAPLPPELVPPLDGIGEYLKAAGIASCCYEGVEADDWIATLARAGVEAGLSVVIASSDKDFMQLVSPCVGLFNPNDKSETVWGAEQVFAKAGVQPGQVVDWLSLVGDAVDNIPGVPGVGTKTAAELLGQFGSVAELFTRLHEVRSEKLRAALQAARETVHRNQQLIRLQDGLPGSVRLEDSVPRPPNDEQLRVLYARWGFKSLLAELGPACAGHGDTETRRRGDAERQRIGETENQGTGESGAVLPRRLADSAAQQGELF